MNHDGNDAPEPKGKMSRLQQMAQAADLYCRGFEGDAAAKQMGCSPRKFWKMIEDVRKHWRESRIRDFDAHLEEELAKIDHLERTAWEEYERSRGDSERKRVRRRGKAHAGQPPSLDDVEMVQITEGRLGDPRYLQQVAWCINKRCELLSLDPAKRVHVTGSAGNMTLQDLVDVLENRRRNGIVDDEFIERRLKMLDDSVSQVIDVEAHVQGSTNGSSNGSGTNGTT